MGLAFVMFSCDSGKKETSNANSTDRTETSSKKNAGKSYDCLKDFQEDYEALLSKAEMSSVYPISDKAEVNLSPGSYGQHIYQWKSDRPSFTMEVSNMKMQVPDQNTIGIKNLSISSSTSDLESIRKFFDMSYKKLSEEELAQIESNLDQAEDDVKETGKGYMEARVKSVWEAVDGLGSSAWYKWSEQWGGELVVLAGKANFTILTKINADPAENKELAIKLAEKVIAKCK